MGFHSILGPVYIRFLLGLSRCHFSISESKCQRLGLPNRGFRVESIGNLCSWKSFLIDCWNRFCHRFKALSKDFRFFGIENRFKSSAPPLESTFYGVSCGQPRQKYRKNSKNESNSMYSPYPFLSWSSQKNRKTILCNRHIPS